MLGGCGSGPDGGGAGRIGKLKLSFSLGRNCIAGAALMPSVSLERFDEAPDVLDVRGGNAWRAKFEP